MKRRGAHQTLKRVTRFMYKKMYDGVHPNAHLKTKWYNSLCQSINNHIEGVMNWKMRMIERVGISRE
jgi:hypothetical protein